MSRQQQIIIKPFCWALLVILVFDWQCLAETVDEQQKEMQGGTFNSEHCTFKNSDEGCAAASDTDGREAYSKSQNQQPPEEAGSREKEDEDYQDFLHRSMERLEGMLGESRDQVLEKLRKVMDKMAHSRDHMIKKLDAVLDTVSHSRIVTELDHLLEEVSHSKIIEDMKSLPRELKESLLLSVRNRSYVAAGIMVIATMAVLVGGSLYFAWCHHDGWSLTYDYKALARGVSAVTGAAQEEGEGQDTEDLSDLQREKVDGGGIIENSQKLGVGEEGNINGFSTPSKDVEGSEHTDSLNMEDSQSSNGVSAVFEKREVSRNSAKSMEGEPTDEVTASGEKKV
ncbi:hypothetical protein ElyMa_001596500 [Elysia marginata]|uniref:Uncharacterized protein n=1 Tax=Elysia marginata TaxID=1093978 RepID=A0AAV4JJ97_9GAST|nr:hypothetical protein ElyMa_001596500 [Elysia marginata]